MALPKIVLRGRKIILLSGFKDGTYDRVKKHRTLVVDAKDKLRKAAKDNPDAVAFGYVAGEWIASA
jgi:predicted RNase H-like nuclease